ncbi:glycerol-3-phosphate dehydrogenase [Methylocystis sp. B8]|uniref:glycerol-3-phosphate dehydrogenase n=1 Tax=Methylocystis sp. B8 TaxID=544938 RepID=UPI0010FF2BEC|nr:glycerol-3-phosphate dehydrogenase [Methylocystis sp. B8]TLG77989.1 glycerol-3-phosphate dehydrogenase [Methylocystis sp. B8]
MIYDLLIVGGGINGCAIARDAAGRGLSVRLVEQGDLAQGTSSASTKLIHGGLRYLELYEFRLVHEALAERELLLAAAPHIIWPLKFVLPYEKGLRPVWLLRLGLFLYDHLARRKRLEGSHMVTLAGDALGAPLRDIYRVGFTYADCWVDDSRLVVLNARDAAERGATINVGAKLIRAERQGDRWRATLEGGEAIEARVLVNAAGPWVSQVLEDALRIHSRKHVRLVKGSHLVLRKLFEGPQAYILQNPDGRIVFAIPYEHDFTLVGTTDVSYEGPPGAVAISDAEMDYLLNSLNHFLRKPATCADIVSSFAGLRPLYDDGSLKASVVTRDYAFDLDTPENGAPSLSIFGGKITTARRLAEHALDQLAAFLPARGEAWTAGAVFPGGDMPQGFDRFLDDLKRDKPFLGDELALRLARAYGTRLFEILKNARTFGDLGRDFGYGLTEAEIAYLREKEWARTAEDILWRRSKLGLHMSAPQQQALREFLGA